MYPVAEAVWQSWQFDPWALALVLMTGVIYVCGWRQVHRQMPHRFGAARLASFDRTSLASAKTMVTERRCHRTPT